AVPLIAVHLSLHLREVMRTLRERQTELPEETPSPAPPRGAVTRRAFVGTVLAGGLGLAVGFQNTKLGNAEVSGLFIGRIPDEEKGGPGDFPVETLFRKADVDGAAWRLTIDGAVSKQVSLTYDDLLKLPSHSETIRISCVSGWSAVPTWSGPRVRDVLALAGDLKNVKSVAVHSVTDYGW